MAATTSSVPVSFNPSPTAGARPVRPLAARLAFPLTYLAIAALVAALFVSVLRVNSGTFLYALDDPYIHLALSTQIRHGNYGLYPGSHAAPSSSILYPFLLAPAAGTRFHPYLPLAINICALFFTVDVMRRFLRHLRLGEGGFAVAAQAGAVFMAAVCFNVAGVIFTGLEHSLHVAAVAASVYGLALFLDRDEVPRWLPAVLVLSPLVRYEGLALSGGILLVLAMRGRVRIALATFTAIAVLVGGFSAFLRHLGLPMLPSSILSKSAIASASLTGGGLDFRSSFVQAIDSALGHPIGLLLLLVGVVVGLRCALEVSRYGILHPRRWTANGCMCLALLCLLTGQTVAGRWGWFERYEVYAILATAMAGVYLAQSAIRRGLAQISGSAGRERFIYAAALASGLFVFGTRYIFTTSKIPNAANNIYEQQFQMHRFVTGFYRAPVAVNDIGQVSYRNPYPVLDLGGLGSEKARLIRERGGSAEEYESLVAASGIHLAIVYDEWFPGHIPESWHKVATMSLSSLNYSSAHPDVQFYVTDAAAGATVRRELEAFRATLPPPVGLTLY